MLKNLLSTVAFAAVAAAPLTPVFDVPAASAATCTVTVRLSPGVRSGSVGCLERRLRALGYTVGTPDVVYDSTSVAAVKAFQRTRGLYPDGLITSITGRQLGLRGALPPAGSPKVTVIGDSTSAAMRWYDEARNETGIYDVMGTSYDLAWSIESCKRLMAPSCVGRVDPGTGNRWIPASVLPELRTTAMRGRLKNSEALVVMAGYDDYPSIADDIDAVVTEATSQGVARVFWLTYRTTTGYKFGGYYRQHNDALLAARVKYPNLTVLDWNAYTHAQNATTQNAWFESDNIHMTRAGGLALARYLKSNVDASKVSRCAATRAIGGSPIDGASPLATPDSNPLRFTPAPPTAVFDTSNSRKVAAGRAVRIDLAALVPVSASSASITVSAVDPCRTGRVAAYASSGATCGPTPGTTTVQFSAGRTSSGMAITSLSNRAFCVYSTVPTDLVVTLTGWFGTDGTDLLHTGPSTRWVDTRGNPARTATAGAVPAGGAVPITIGGLSPVPAGATAALLNVTIIAPSRSTRALLLPGDCSGAAPNTFTVAAAAGRTTAAATIVQLDADGVA